MEEDAFTRFRRVRGLASPPLPSLTPHATLVALHTAGATLTLGYQDVTIVPPSSGLPSWLQAAMTKHKTALVDLVEALEERMAILEYDGSLPQEEAERLAWERVLAPLPAQAGAVSAPLAPAQSARLPGGAGERGG